MNKHPYHQLITILRKKRTIMIGEFRHFKRNTVNRKWLSHSAFSTTVNKFRREIAELDKLLAGGRLAIHASKKLVWIIGLIITRTPYTLAICHLRSGLQNKCV